MEQHPVQKFVQDMQLRNSHVKTYFPIKNPFLKVFQNILKNNFFKDINTCEDLAIVLNRCTSELKEKIRQEYNGNNENFETALYHYFLV